MWEWTGQKDMGNIIRRILRWMGHEARMEGDRRAIRAGKNLRF